MKRIKNLFIALFLSLTVLGTYAQTNVQWDTPLGFYSLFESSGGIQRQTGPAFSYTTAGTAASVQTVSEGQSVTVRIYSPTNNWAIFLSPSKPKSFVIDDQNDNGTWVGSDATVPFGVQSSLLASGQITAFEAGDDVGTPLTVAWGTYLRILYENATTVRYQTSTNGTDFTTFHTSAGDPSGSYYVIFQAIGQYSTLGLAYISAGGGGGGGNQPPSIIPINDVYVTQPSTSTSLSVSATDSDGTIASYAWSKISGPSGGSITSPATSATDITNLTSLGTYVYRVSVTDDDGAVTTADVNIIVTESNQSGGQAITPTIIPFSATEVLRWNAGANDWNFQHETNSGSWAGGVAGTPSIPTATERALLKSVYFRFNWYEIEADSNTLITADIDRLFRTCIDRGQSISIGIMAVNAANGWYTGINPPSDQGYLMNYPMFLHQLMQSDVTNNRDWVGGGFWIPNYNSPHFLRRARAMMQKFVDYLRTAEWRGVKYIDIVDVLENRLYGFWGEWHAYPYAEDPSAYPPGRQPTVPTLDSIAVITARVAPELQTDINISVFDAYLLRNTWIDPAVAKFVLQFRYGPDNKRFGWRKDHVGSSFLEWTYGQNWTYLNQRGYGDRRSEVDYQMGDGPTWTGVANTLGGPYGIDTAVMNNLWRTAPVSGEPPGGSQGGPSGLDMSYIPREVKLWRHNSFGNGNYGASYGSQWQVDGDSIRLASKLAGARIQIRQGVVSNPISPNSQLILSLDWENVGLTPVYNLYHTLIYLENTSGQVVWTDTSKFQARWFQPTTPDPLRANLSVPVRVIDTFSVGNIPVGTYRLVVRFKDPLGNGYRKLPLHNQGTRTDYSLVLNSQLQVVASGSNQAPTVYIPNINQGNIIVLPTNSTSITAVATDVDGTISTYAWSKLSGPAATISAPAASTTSLTGLVEGTYTFQCVVTDNLGLTAQASITITVNPAIPNPVAPTANAGADSTIQLPKNTVTLIGSGTDPDGTISSYSWSKVSGPNASVVTPNNATTRLENLLAGVYVFRLTVTDNSGSTGTDDVTVTVLPVVVNTPPSADAGPDQVLKLPLTSIQLAGSGADTDGTIASYLWQLVSGPTCTITNPTQFNTTVTNLQAGVYTFQLTVTDNLGASDTDTINVYISIDGRRKRFRIVKQ